MSAPSPTPGAGRQPSRRVALAVGAVALSGLAACTRQRRPEPSGPTPADPAPPTTTRKAPMPPTTPPVDLSVLDTVLDTASPAFGVFVPGAPPDMSALAPSVAAAGAAPVVVGWFHPMTAPMPAQRLNAVAATGATNLLSLEPWAGRGHGDLSLDDVASGRADDHLRAIATSVVQANVPLVVRYAHEMNGDWYPWGRGGGSPAQYVASFRRARAVFEEAGARARWLWCPQLTRDGAGPSFQDYFPGDDVVDYVGVTGYGASYEDHPSQTFGADLPTLRSLSARPLVLPETGAWAGAGKAAWTTALVPYLREQGVGAFVWTEALRDSGSDGNWAYSADPDSAAAMRATLATGARTRPA